MSAIQNTPFKKPGCGNTTSGQLRDVLGGLINLQIVGTDPDVVGPITGTYTPDAGNVNPDGTFFLIPESDTAVYVVVLEDGTEYTITAVQSKANLGMPIPMRIIKVISSTGYYSVAY